MKLGLFVWPTHSIRDIVPNFCIFLFLVPPQRVLIAIKTTRMPKNACWVWFQKMSPLSKTNLGVLAWIWSISRFRYFKIWHFWELPKLNCDTALVMVTNNFEFTGLALFGLGAFQKFEDVIRSVHVLYIWAGGLDQLGNKQKYRVLSLTSSTVSKTMTWFGHKLSINKTWFTVLIQRPEFAFLQPHTKMYGQS